MPQPRESLFSNQAVAASKSKAPSQAPLEKVLEATRASWSEQASELELREGIREQLQANEAALPKRLSAEELTIIEQALVQAKKLSQFWESEEPNAQAALYETPGQQEARLVKEQEPYLDRFTRLIALHVVEALGEKRFAQQAFETETLRRDNLVLAQYVQRLLQQLETLEAEKNALQQEVNRFHPTMGGFYRKSAD